MHREFVSELYMNPDERNPHPCALFLNFNIEPFTTRFPSFDTWYRPSEVSSNFEFISYLP
jgi:hypothetical protein